MTISEQLREAALYAERPWVEMSANQFITCCGYKLGSQSLVDLPTVDLRTFMLLVAEAIE